MQEAEADVLTILDTCSAGSVVKGVSDDARIHEVLAAAGRRAPTDAPGPRSFTRALIDSLKEQLGRFQDTPFTTYDLNQAIMRRRKNHNSNLFRINETHSHRFIKLAPLDEKEKVESPVTAKDSSYLTLRFVFRDSTSFSSKQAETLAKELSQGAVRSQLDVRAIEWVDFQANKDSDRLVEAVRLFVAVRRVQRRWRASKDERHGKRRSSELSEGEATRNKRQRTIRRWPLSPSRSHSESFDMLSPSPSVKSNNHSPC